jgi:hypothetical protein
VLQLLVRRLVQLEAESYVLVVFLVDGVELNSSGECDGERNGQKAVAHGIWRVGGLAQFVFKF